MSTAAELLAQLAGKKVSAVEVTQAALERIAELEPHIHAFLSVHRDQALARAAEVDAGKVTGPLAGVPIALKDNLCMRGELTTCGSRILEKFRPPYDATVVQRLEAAGAVVVGKTNLDEFAMGSSTENSAFGPTRNPWDTSRVPGGSSGGSAAAVASGEVPLSLGSDTGGSIRQPAALCGVVGLKPTYGRVSRYGLVAFASSLDQIGPFARDVRDAALLLQVIAGHDPLDSTSGVQEVPDYTAALEPRVHRKLGIPRAFLEGLSSEMRAVFDESCEALKGLGATLVDVDLPSLKAALAAYYIIAPAEASSNLARYDGVRYGLRVETDGDIVSMMRASRAQGFGAEVKRRIMLGTYALSSGYYDAYYHKAQQARTVIRNDFERAFADCDCVLMPTTPSPAFKIGEKSEDPLEMYLTDVYTVSANLAGLPGLVVPSGTVQGLPSGLQILGRAWDEATLLSVGYAYQEATGHHLRRPELKAGV